MCALTKTILPEFGAAEPPPASAINFDVLKDLARLDGHHERHGSLLGTSAIHALHHIHPIHPHLQAQRTHPRIDLFLLAHLHLKRRPRQLQLQPLAQQFL